MLDLIEHFLNTTLSQLQTTKKLTSLLRIVVIALATIGIAMVIRRGLVLSNLIPPSFNASRMPALNNDSVRYKVIMLIHILPGALFMILGPLQFMPQIRSRHIQFHRWSGRIFVISAYLVGVTAISLPLVATPIGGLSEGAGSIFFGIFFLIALSKACWHILRKEIGLRREWMIRAFAIGLAVATIRPIIGLFYGFSGLTPQQFFGTAFWIGFTLHVIVAEIWINYTRNSQRTPAVSSVH